MRLLLPIFVCLLAGSLAAQPTNVSWKLAKEDGRLKIYTADKDDNILVKFHMEVDASVADLMQYVSRAESYPEWIHRCKTARRLKTVDANRYYYYSHINLPLPFSDRDIIAVVTETTDAATGEVRRTIAAVPDYLPEEKGKQRIQQYDSSWRIRPLADGSTFVECIVESDAGKGLPGWLRTDIMTGGPSKTMHNLAALAEARQ